VDDPGKSSPRYLPRAGDTQRKRHTTSSKSEGDGDPLVTRTGSRDEKGKGYSKGSGKRVTWPLSQVSLLVRNTLEGTGDRAKWTCRGGQVICKHTRVSGGRKDNLAVGKRLMGHTE